MVAWSAWESSHLEGGQVPLGVLESLDRVG